MNTTPAWHEDTPKFSFDGYIRLTFEAFTQLAFQRKTAWEDPELGDELRAQGFPAFRAGCCEWQTASDRAISLGWTWFATFDGTMFIAPGDVNSNLMLVTSKSYDMGATRTSELLRAWLSSVSWQPESISQQF